MSVLSRNYFAFEIEFMRKLNSKKIRWLMRQIDRGAKPTALAPLQKVSVRRVQQLYREYKRTQCVPVLKYPGRKRKPIPDEMKKMIDKEYSEHYVGPLALEKIIMRKHRIHIPHNTIYRHMLENGKIEENPKKKKQRKWVRYEREHSLSLVHTDWCEFEGKQVIAYLDDASRMILACMEFDAATTENTIIALDAAREKASGYGGVRQLITDHGSVFTAVKTDKDGYAEHKFEIYLESVGIEHIMARVKHPQTNGKMERWFGCYKKHRKRFAKLDEFVIWYNEKKPHMSLNFNKAETPGEAFQRKMSPEIWFSRAENWF